MIGGGGCHGRPHRGTQGAKHSRLLQGLRREGGRRYGIRLVMSCKRGALAYLRRGMVGGGGVGIPGQGGHGRPYIRGHMLSSA